MQRRTATFAVGLGLALMFATSAAVAQYKITNLVSNQTGQARHDDPLLVNAWGLARSPGSPFWVSDNGSGWSTLYTGAGIEQGLKVTVPSANGKGPGQPTGIVFNGSTTGEFQVQGGQPFFIFATFDGAIAGWAPSVNPNAAIIAVNNSSSLAQYTGLAITNHASGNFLYAADAWNNKVDIYDGNWNWVKSFTDPTIPAGYAPFGIQDIDGLLFVSFAAQSGAPGGVIDIYSEDGTWLKQLTEGGPLNQPWGFAAAPKNFGPLSNTLLVGNDNGGASTINAFNVLTGQFVGTIKDGSGKAITIDQLWGLEFGGGTAKNGAANQLFFTAGPNSSLAGTFGVITYAP